jgi:hypothetical protein
VLVLVVLVLVLVEVEVEVEVDDVVLVLLVVGVEVDVVVLLVELELLVELVAAVVVPDAGAASPRSTAHTAAIATSAVSATAPRHTERFVSRLGTPQVCQWATRSRPAIRQPSS